MSQIIVVTSGKGGVGKTTTSASFAVGLALKGYRTLVVDFDVGLRNLDILMGCERRVVYDFIDVINKEVSLHRALIRDKRVETLSILPTSQTRDKTALNLTRIGEIFSDLANDFDYIVCDSPAGIEQGALSAFYYADHAIITVNPEISSVRDADRIIGMIQSKSKKAEQGKDSVTEHLLITRYNNKRAKKGETLDIESVQEILSLPIIGTIPESEDVVNASNLGIPIIHNTKSVVSKAYKEMVDCFLGEQKIENHKNLFGKILEKLW